MKKPGMQSRTSPHLHLKGSIVPRASASNLERRRSWRWSLTDPVLLQRQHCLRCQVFQPSRSRGNLHIVAGKAIVKEHVTDEGCGNENRALFGVGPQSQLEATGPEYDPERLSIRMEMPMLHCESPEREVYAEDCDDVVRG